MPSPKWVEIASKGAIGLAEYYLEAGTDPGIVRGILADKYPGYTASSYDAIISRANDAIQAAEFLEFETGGEALTDVLIPVDPSKKPGYYYKSVVEVQVGEEIFERYIYDRYSTSKDLADVIKDMEEEAKDQFDTPQAKGKYGSDVPIIISSRITAITRGE